ncbi:Protein msta, isoform A [Papilio machaon]|uniref:Protein msta, isoform A n=1 Tax=Papilio machaon TaxID=76193 RepID=A0A194RMV7_PAPMA|nr:Protein msta, isoform A [Papilio machaon]
MSAKYEVQVSEQLGRYIVAAKDLKAGESILSDKPFVLGPSSDTSLICYNCYLPLMSKFVVCKLCAVAPICPGDGCPQNLVKWHSEFECDFFKTLKLKRVVNPMTMVQNVGSLLVLRAVLKKDIDKTAWQEFLHLETHLNERKGTSVWEYIVAAKDLKAGESILSDKPFVLGPSSDTSLICYNCYLPLMSKFVVCKLCAVAPICPGDGCPQNLVKWHSEFECDFFKTLKLKRVVNPMTMVQNVGSLLVLRAVLKKDIDKIAWQEFLHLETHLNERKGTSVWEYCENTDKFTQSLGLLDNTEDNNLVQKVCAAIDVNSFEVRGPPLPAIGCSEILRGVYLKAALMAHDCVANTHVAINDGNELVCHASTDIKKGETIYYNYTDPLKGTLIRQQHLLIGKYFKCTCKRCQDVTEMDTYMSSALCSACKTGYMSEISNEKWACHSCGSEYESSVIKLKVQCCSDKLAVINKKDEKELEEYIKNISLVLAPNHYLLLDAKQRLAGILRDAINRQPRPTKKMMRRKIELCRELLPVLEKISPKICRIKAITLYELHATKAHLAKKLFDGREINGSQYLEELQDAEKYLKKSLEMLLIEPGNSPEGELCSKALEDYRALKNSISGLMLGLHSESKSLVNGRNKGSDATNGNI